MDQTQRPPDGTQAQRPWGSQRARKPWGSQGPRAPEALTWNHLNGFPDPGAAHFFWHFLSNAQQSCDPATALELLAFCLLFPSSLFVTFPLWAHKAGVCPRFGEGLGGSRSVSGRLSRVLGRLGGVLGAFWGVLERLEGVLGASWGVLGCLGDVATNGFTGNG